MGRGPAIFFTLCGFLVMNLVAIPGIQSGSRTIFALARDDLLPFSSTWRRISKRSQTPIAAVWIYAAVEITVNMLGLASDTAISSVFNVCTVALNLSYVVPIVCKLVYGKFDRGPWNLGRWSTLTNIIAVAWNGFVVAIFFFPTNLPVTPQSVSTPLPILLTVRELQPWRALLTLPASADELRRRRICFRRNVCCGVLVHSRASLLYGSSHAGTDKKIPSGNYERGIS